MRSGSSADVDNRLSFTVERSTLKPRRKTGLYSLGPFAASAANSSMRAASCLVISCTSRRRLGRRSGENITSLFVTKTKGTSSRGSKSAIRDPMFTAALYPMFSR
ncbi:hypothetical protein TcCL_Unassigned00651 [Trypanosoma cruzi]|nr:hypothetical protein TcCL_Unassigned00651 [Trypanosoma cruzi]